MASREQIDNFISTLAPVIQKVCKERGYHIASTVIAQACLETGFGCDALSKYHNYFGMKCGRVWKGSSINLRTKEEYSPGILTDISANFRTYPDMISGINGYYDFINWSNYANLKIVNTYQQYAQCLKQDGWATDSQYVAKLCKIVEDYNLTRFDEFQTVPTVSMTTYRVTTEKGLLIRKEPNTSAEIVTGMPYKSIFEIDSESNGWGHIPNKGWSCLAYAERL